MNERMKKAAILLFWLMVWGVAALAVHNSILLVGPVETGKRFAALFSEKEFYLTVAHTLGRILLGFFCGCAAAFLLAALAAKRKWVEELFAPVMRLFAAMPVASFVVLLLIWWGSSFLAVAISFLMVLPIVYLNTLEGIRAVDESLLEMAKVHRLPGSTVFFYIIRPALEPFLAGCLKTAAGLGWKAGVAAEVIGIPGHSVGEKLYLSKVYLDTADLFAWTVVIIVLSFGFERFVLWLLRLFMKLQPACRKPKRSETAAAAVETIGLCKAFGEEKVLTDVSVRVAPGEICYLREPSGSGKTTLLRILAGLETADKGEVRTGEASVCFQEDRLCEQYSALKNVEMVTGDRARARHALLALLDEDSIEKPCAKLSGGMKRRVAVARAMEAESAVVLLDEPYAGLDEENRKAVEKYVISRQGNRPAVVASHI